MKTIVKTIGLNPAYGRDYPSALAARLALAQGKDFIIADISNRWDGKPVNLPQLREAGYERVTLRYGGLRHATVVDITKNIE